MLLAVLRWYVYAAALVTKRKALKGQNLEGPDMAFAEAFCALRSVVLTFQVSCASSYHLTGTRVWMRGSGVARELGSTYH